MSEWNEIRLGDLCTFISRGITPQYVDVGTPVINQKCIRNNEVDLSLCKFTDTTQKIKNEKYVEYGDILINSTGTGTLGRVAIYKHHLDSVSADGHVTILHTKGNVNSVYLGYYLHSIEPLIENLGRGSTNQMELSPTDLKRIKIVLPCLDTQKRIAEILSAYDDLIENNNRRIALLEKAAQELYKEWFVRFRFPGYENAKFENGLPEGWERTTFEKIASFQNGYAFKSNELLDSAEPNTYEVFKQGHIKRGGGFKAEGTKSWYHKSSCTGLQKFVLHKKDVLMAMTDMKDNVAILGNTAIMPYDNRYILNQRVGLLRPTHYRGTDFAYIHLLTNSYDFVQDLRSRANRGVQVNLSAVQIRESETVVPSEIINKKFAKIMDPIFEEIFNIMIQSENLAKQRDLLLPRLMSGKLEV